MKKTLCATTKDYNNNNTDIDNLRRISLVCGPLHSPGQVLLINFRSNININICEINAYGGNLLYVFGKYIYF